MRSEQFIHRIEADPRAIVIAKVEDPERIEEIRWIGGASWCWEGIAGIAAELGRKAVAVVRRDGLGEEGQAMFVRPRLEIGGVAVEFNLNSSVEVIPWRHKMLARSTMETKEQTGGLRHRDRRA